MGIIFCQHSQLALRCLKALSVSSFLLITACAGGSSDKPASSLDEISTEKTQEPSTVELINSTPLWEGQRSAGKEWTAHVMNTLDHLGKDLLSVSPSDAKTFCPSYSRLTYSQKKQYWTFMLSAMARFESNFNPETSFRESFRDGSGKRVVSRGLLQISMVSGNDYGCGFRAEKDVHDPYQNLSCGIRILNRWMVYDKRIAGKVSDIWRGGARYWSVLREGNKTSYRSILDWSRNLGYCKK